MANHFVETHPDDPLAEEIRASLPVYLKAEATAALDHAQPLLALLYFQGYRQLDFAPADAELERRIGKLRQASEPRAGRRRRPTPGTAPDGP
jgi:hypothetical protein